MRQAMIMNNASASSSRSIRRELHFFDVAAVLQHIEEDLDFPPAAIPVNQFGGLFQQNAFPFVHLRLPPFGVTHPLPTSHYTQLRCPARVP
jgi:hypothetical protein